MSTFDFQRTEGLSLELDTGVFIPEKAARLARVYVGVTTTLLFLCTLTFLVRIYQRLWRHGWKIGWDDYFIIAGYCLSVVTWAFLLPAFTLNAGLVPTDTRTSHLRLSWIAIGLWGISMTCLKVSIALTLLRIQRKSLRWRIFLFSIIGLQAAYGTLNLLFNLVIACRPLEQAWNVRMTTGTCVSVNTIRVVSHAGSVVNITTDLLLSFAPALFLSRLHRPLLERIFICFLMGLGLFASGWSIAKAVMIEKYFDPAISYEESVAVGVLLSTYTILELFTCALAACAPAQKNFLQACLGRIGVSLTDSDSLLGHYGYYVSGRWIGGSHRNGGFRILSHDACGRTDGAVDDTRRCLELLDRQRGLPTRS
ncbi:hypothetical protein B0T14DRAFT_523736 [Immersiella caudata]|uniref:Rhodopsin domain-containing protein n=1 Tax=Immersiella caudata TaxID=314043 RepID=A0AA39WJX6_9PEZI|nr:hypothetical protein B0T14DRAFT_523736 [Immersiella caudata]